MSRHRPRCGRDLEGIHWAGAESARAFAGDYGISLVFRGNLTQLEKTAVERGQGATIASIRRGGFQANRAKLIEAVERESGRKVEAALYAFSPEQDMSAFTFVAARSRSAYPPGLNESGPPARTARS